MTLAVGDLAPNFTLPSSGGQSVTLADLTAKSTVVVFFYPKDDTPACTVEACGFRDRYEAFTEGGATVVGISADSVESHDRFATKHRLPMTLLSDADGAVRALYGVKPTLGVFPGRATFVIGQDRKVAHVFVSQLRAEKHVAEALGVVQRLARAPKADVTAPS